MKTKITLLLLIVSTVAFSQSSVNILQSDNANQVTLEQIGAHSVNVIQLGLMNLTAVLQTGMNNQLHVEQVLSSYGNLMFSTQRGQTNLAELYQINNDNRAYLTQDGNNNTSYQYQNIGNVNTSSSEISQYSNGNYASTNQSSGTRLSALIEQNGLTNRGTVTQSGGAATLGHSARLWQFGDNNIATQNQSGVVPLNFLPNSAVITQVFTSSSQATQTQSGSENSSSITQVLGNTNVASTNQTGNKDQSLVTQSGANNSTSIVQHAGDQNYVNIIQTNAGTASIDQTGSMNSLKGIDAGIDVDQAQSLDGSNLTVIQNGISNLSRIFQWLGETISITQTGSSNVVVIQQH